jgi:hypothetical protein
MIEKLTVQEYVRKSGISQATVYRHIKTGKLSTEKVDGIPYIIINDENNDKNETQIDNELVGQLRTENDYLRKQLEDAMRTIQRMQEDSESDKQRSDTIILSLTRQFEEQTKMLEDMRHRSMWSRVKTAFGFAAS